MSTTSRAWIVLCLRRLVYWRAQSAGYTDDPVDAGHFSDAQALNIAHRMNGGGDSPVQLIPYDDFPRWLTESEAGRKIAERRSGRA